MKRITTIRQAMSDKCWDTINSQIPIFTRIDIHSNTRNLIGINIRNEIVLKTESFDK